MVLYPNGRGTRLKIVPVSVRIRVGLLKKEEKMVSSRPRVPRREFTIKYKGKSAKVFAVTHDVGGERDLWGGQVMCLWGCPRTFEVSGKISPKRVQALLESALKAHWRVIHKEK